LHLNEPFSGQGVLTTYMLFVQPLYIFEVKLLVKGASHDFVSELHVQKIEWTKNKHLCLFETSLNVLLLQLKAHKLDNLGTFNLEDDNLFLPI